MAGLVALVTGASSGIGRATALRFAAEGYKIAATGRNQQSLDSLTVAVVEAGGQCISFTGDVASDSDVSKVVTGCVEKYGGVDVLVNSAGVLKGGAADAIAMENFDYNFNVNCRGAFCFMKECIPHLKEASGGAGCIINVSSVNGMQSFAGAMSYGASKAALDMMTRCAAVDLAPHGIRVNSVNPGVVITELQQRGGLDDDAYAAFLERSKTVTHPLGRVGKPEEIAEAILFLATASKSGFITGANLPIDGGRACLGAR